jgi:hypothetical protein
MSKSMLSPKEFLKARHPERFSDSSTEDVTEVDRAMLEYHLESITSRSQETAFERFSRALIRLEVCPNILPQTGPMGGGDSKVDSETYPVADSLALAWYVDVGRAAASERWAFAFSAKKEWRGKLKSDVAKIASVNRGYAKAFFVTNQYVPDKKRSELEDELRKCHSIDVRIFDRTWILDTVFEHGRQEIAITELGVSPTIRKHVNRGPIDIQREAELAHLEDRIAQRVSNNDYHFVTVDDCISAAVISRELERPSTETVGRFARAANMAAKYGTQQQRVRCAYDHAWTAFFWFEDNAAFARLYGEAERFAEGSRNIYDLELLTNLWMLLHAHARNTTDYEHHTTVLQRLLITIAADNETPTAALQARAFLLNIQLAQAAADQKPIGPLVSEFSGIIKTSEAFIGYPLLPLADLLLSLGEVLGDVAEYEALHDQLVEVVARRTGEVEGARLLVRRAEQHLDGDRPIDAVRSVGKALRLLAKHESRTTFGHALYACACAYERIGLLWAARGTLLMAASVSMSDFWEFEDATPFQATCLRRLKWVELQIGRVPQLLSWHEVDSIIRGILIAKGYDEHRLIAGDIEFDAILGILFLKTEFGQLKHIVRLPDRLSSMRLNQASVAVLYTLGHDSEIGATSVVGKTDEEILSFFVAWRDQPASNELSGEPDFCDRVKLELRSQVLGCEFKVTMPNEAPFVELGESLLAAIEATLATGLARKLIACEPKADVTIYRSDFCEEPFEYTIDNDSGYTHLAVTCRKFDPDRLSAEQQGKVKERIAQMVAAVVGYTVVPVKERIVELFRDDDASSRAINFTSSFQVIGNILGSDRKRHTSSWVDGDLTEYPARRSGAWDAGCPRAAPEMKSFNDALRRTSPPDRRTLEQPMQTTKHSHVKTLSLIRETLWTNAKWRGVGFVACPNALPILALVFGNREAAGQIFKLWEQELGRIDEADALRVCIIRGINKREPHHYRVVLGSNLESAIVKSDAAFLAVAQRIHTMTPSSSENLESFLSAYEASAGYLLAPAVIDSSGRYPEPIGDSGIKKRLLFVRDAWTVGVNDFDGAGIQPSDDPIIPDGVTDAPVKQLLERKLSQTPRKPPQDRNSARDSSSRARKKKRKKQKLKRVQVRKSRRKR